MFTRAISLLGLVFIFPCLSWSIAPKSDRIQVATYNAGLFLLVPHRMERSELLSARAKKLMATQDLICLQEFWESEKEKHAAQFTRNLKNFHVLRPNRLAKPKFYDSGLIILARKNLFDLEAKIKLPEPENLKKVGFKASEVFLKRSFFERSTEKGIFLTFLRHRPTQTPFVFACTHMQVISVNPKGISKDKIQQGIHSSQVDQIAKWLNFVSKRGEYPVIFAGDFNVGLDLGKPLFESMLEKLSLEKNPLVDVYNGLPPSKKIKNYYTWSRDNLLVQQGFFKTDPFARVDHITIRQGKEGKIAPIKMSPFLGASQTVKIKGKNYPFSDHYGLSVELKLRR